MVVLLFLLHCFHVAHDYFHGLLQFLCWTELPNLSSRLNNTSVPRREIIRVSCLGDLLFPVVYYRHLTFYDDSPVWTRVAVVRQALQQGGDVELFFEYVVFDVHVAPDCFVHYYFL